MNHQTVSDAGDVVKRKIVLVIILMLFLPVSLSTATQITIQETTAKVHQSFTVNVSCTPTEPIKAYEFKIRFDPRILSATSLSAGSFFLGQPVFSSPNCVINNTQGTIINIYALTVGKGYMVTKPGVLVSIQFTAKQNGSSPIIIYDAGVTNDTRYLPLKTTNGSVTINGVMQTDQTNQSDDTPPDTTPPDDPPPDDKPPTDDTPPDEHPSTDYKQTQQENNEPDSLSWLTQNLIIVLIVSFIVLFIINKVIL